MPALDVLVVLHRVPVLPQPRDELPRVPGVDAVVAGRGGHEDRRVRRIRSQLLVRRVLRDEGPVVGVVGVAVLGHPRRAREQQVEPAHVQQRHHHDDRPEQLRVPRDHHAHEQPAVRAAVDRELGRRRDPASDEVPRDRGEVLVGAVAVLAQRRGVPLRAVLPAAADVRDDVGAAGPVPRGLDPAAAHHPGVRRRPGDLEPAVAGHQHRTRRRTLPPDDEVGHLRPVVRGREELPDGDPGGVEELRCGAQRLERRILLGGVAEHRAHEGRGPGEAVGVEEDLVALVGIDPHDADDGEVVARGQLAPRPRARGRDLRARGRGHDLQPRRDVVEQGQYQVVPRPGPARERAARRRGEHHGVVPPARQVVLGPEGQQDPRRELDSGHRPRRAGAHQQPRAFDLGIGVGGHVEEDPRAVGPQHELLGGVEVRAAAHEVALEADGVVVPGERGDVGLGALEHHRRVGDRRAPRPAPHHARVARRRHRPRSEVGPGEHRVVVDPRDPALGLRQREPALGLRDETLLGQVELPHHGRVRAAAGELHQRAGVVRPARRRARPDPVLVLVGRERVDVEQQLPVRVTGAVGVQGGPAPQPARVLGVLPEVVEQVPPTAGVGDPVVGVQHRAQPVAQRGEPFALGQHAQALAVALVDPGQGLVAGDLLQPEVRVVDADLGGGGGHSPILPTGERARPGAVLVPRSAPAGPPALRSRPGTARGRPSPVSQVAHPPIGVLLLPRRSSGPRGACRSRRGRAGRARGRCGRGRGRRGRDPRSRSRRRSRGSGAGRGRTPPYGRPAGTRGRCGTAASSARRRRCAPPAREPVGLAVPDVDPAPRAPLRARSVAGQRKRERRSAV